MESNRIFLKTERLEIRPIEIQDLDDISRMLADVETMKFFVEGTYSRTQVQKIIEDDAHTGYHLAVFLKGSHQFVGKISFQPWFAPRTYEIGWIFDKNHTRRGYCFEAADAIVCYGFDEMNLHRIVATCQPENTASSRICEKLGMRLEGNFKQCIHFKEDVWWDELLYAILKEEL